MRSAIGISFIVAAAIVSKTVAAQADGDASSPRALEQDAIHGFSTPRTYDGPPLTLSDAVGEALARNPDLVAVRQQTAVARQRPAQERALMPPLVEATV